MRLNPELLRMLEQYVQSINTLDLALARRLWVDSEEVSFPNCSFCPQLHLSNT